MYNVLNYGWFIIKKILTKWVRSLGDLQTHHKALDRKTYTPIPSSNTKRQTHKIKIYNETNKHQKIMKNEK